MKIQKKNPAGEVVFEYDAARVLERGGNRIVVEAFFGRDDMQMLNVTLKRGDRFVETFYSDKWHNIFEIYDRDDLKLKGWYCNIGQPAMIEDGVVSYVDLALDLWVAPDGSQTVLDEDELDALDADEALKQKARESLRELQKWFIDTFNTEETRSFKTKNPPV